MTEALTIVPSTVAYNATISHIHDGDTLTLWVDIKRSTQLVDQYLGFNVYVQAHRLVLRAVVRMYGINAPELANPDGSGVAAQQYLIGLAGQQGSALTVVPWMVAGRDSQEKYGRWLCDLRTGSVGGSGVWLNKAMVDSGHAVAYFGGSR